MSNVPDVKTTGAALLAAYVTKDTLNKILGPTAELIGEQLRNFIGRKIKNVGRIFQKAERKLGDRTCSNGSVPPKVLCQIMNDGAFCEDELSAEYFGGVLASSRSSIPRDDRGVPLLALISRLSTYQIRTHYIMYSVYAKTFKGERASLLVKKNETLEVFIPMQAYSVAMGFSRDEESSLYTFLGHSFFGLKKEGLIETFAYGSLEHLRKIWSLAESDGVLCSPSALGAELFLWAHGISDKSPNHLFDPSIPFEPLEGVGLPDGDKRTARVQ